MAARIFVGAILAAVLAAPGLALAADTNISGAELLARCEGTPQMQKVDLLYCKGYLEGIEDYVSHSEGTTPFCVPGGGVTDDELRATYMSWAKANGGSLSQPALNAALAALAAAYPCVK